MAGKHIYLTEEQVSEIKQKIKAARKETDINPSDKQKEAGNYKKGKVSIMGYSIVIENPKGSYRSGIDRSGEKWKTKMTCDYGYFSNTLGYDGDAVDVFIGNNFSDTNIFAIDQKIGGKFDETKIMLGFKDEESAKKAYLSNYNTSWTGFWKITEVSHEVFKWWLYDGYKQRKPFFEYITIKNQKLNESRFQNWEEETIEKVQRNGFIKLYHNTRADNLDLIIIDGELSPKIKHKEGHGNMLFFTINEDAWNSETKISIEVPVKEFENRIFKFVNTDSVITEYTIPIKNYNFKIEDFKGVSFDRIMEIFDGNDSKLISYILNDLLGDYASVREWFLKMDGYKVLDKDW